MCHRIDKEKKIRRKNIKREGKQEKEVKQPKRRNHASRFLQPLWNEGRVKE